MFQMLMSKRFVLTVTVMVAVQIGLFFLFVAMSSAQIVTLQWDPSPSENVQGYRLFQAMGALAEDGTLTHEYDYSNPVVGEGYPTGDMDADTRMVMLDLDGSYNEDVVYYWVVRAFAMDVESEDSNEVTLTVNQLEPLQPPVNLRLQ